MLEDARAVAERFLLLMTPPKAAAKVSVQHRYGSAPARTLRFSPEGHFRVEGATDLAGRAVLAQLATRDPRGTYHLNVAAIRAGALTTAARDALTARTRGGLPPQLGALLNIWAGGDAPAVAKVSVFQHASAAALAKHPGIAPHLGAQLNDTSYLVEAGREKDLEQTLADLGVTFTRDFTAGVRAQVLGGDTVQRGLNTRKMRELIENTIAEGRALELHYHREKELYDGYGYSKKSKGKAVTEKVTPDAVVYSGSTPYLTGENAQRGGSTAISASATSPGSRFCRWASSRFKFVSVWLAFRTQENRATPDGGLEIGLETRLPEPLIAGSIWFAPRSVGEAQSTTYFKRWYLRRNGAVFLGTTMITTAADSSHALL